MLTGQRVIFFIATVFDKRDYHRFGFDIIQKRSFKVEAWNFSPWHRPEYFKNYKSPIPIKFDGHRLFNTRKQVEKHLSNLSTNDIVVDVWQIINDYPFIQDIIQKKKITFGNLFLGSLPDSKPLSSIKYMLVSENNKSYELKKVVKAFYKRILQTRSFFMPNISNKKKPMIIPSFFICGGEKAYKRYSDFSNVTTDVIKTHALDYDRYLAEESKNENADIEGNYAIFLDEDIPFHPDYLHWGIKPFCDPQNYYSELNYFFQFFEKSFGFPILIAAHPRADYSIRDNPFDGRKLIIGKTIHCVKYSTIVLSHMSTSKNFAVLYKKPIVFIDSDSYSLRFREEILGHATALGRLPVNISNDLHKSMINGQIDKVLYKNYKETYIKESGTPEKPVWDVFCDYLDTMNA